jgi:hypothetical protein
MDFEIDEEHDEQPADFYLSQIPGAVLASTKFVCPTCQHRGTENIWPPFLEVVRFPPFSLVSSLLLSLLCSGILEILKIMCEINFLVLLNFQC